MHFYKNLLHYLTKSIRTRTNIKNMSIFSRTLQHQLIIHNHISTKKRSKRDTNFVYVKT